ncbi:MAG: hypothetical protein K2L67_03865 [Clostridia bacterium]|nr:hypothetical protein [Clostridia bacterium]
MMIASVILNMSYRKNSIKAGALSTVIFVISGFMLLGPFGVLLVLGAYFTAGKQPVSLKLKDENGNEYNLSPTFAGSSEYRDQNGCLWTTRDGGNSFECEVINVKNADGTEVNLKRSYKDAFKEYYKDENGEEWTSSDGGKTFDKK